MQALHGGDQVGIQAKLQDGPALGLSGELRVNHLVGPGTKIACGLSPPENVRPANPAVRSERPLHDDFFAGHHGISRPRDGNIVDADPIDYSDAETLRSQM